MTSSPRLMRSLAAALVTALIAGGAGDAPRFGTVTTVPAPRGQQIRTAAMGDLDGDGDLDIYGLNWVVSGGFTDITLRNDGAGTYSGLTALGGSGSDDYEGDFIDYDNDGDKDFVVAGGGADGLDRWLVQSDRCLGGIADG